MYTGARCRREQKAHSRRLGLPCVAGGISGTPSPMLLLLPLFLCPSCFCRLVRHHCSSKANALQKRRTRWCAACRSQARRSIEAESSSLEYKRALGRIVAGRRGPSALVFCCCYFSSPRTRELYGKHVHIPVRCMIAVGACSRTCGRGPPRW
jgi:hypothetical protein